MDLTVKILWEKIRRLSENYMIRKHSIAILLLFLSSACACIQKKEETPIGKVDPPAGEVQGSKVLLVLFYPTHSIIKLSPEGMMPNAVAYKLTVNGEYYGWFLAEDFVRTSALEKTPEKNKLELVFTNIEGKVVGTKSYQVPFKDRL